VRKSVVVDQAAADDQPEWPRPQVLRDKVKWISALTSACFALIQRRPKRVTVGAAATVTPAIRCLRTMLLARLSLCFVLAAGASVPTNGVGTKAGVPGVGVPGLPGISPARKDGMKSSGAFAPGELQPGELSKMRDTMRKEYCANGAHPTTAPCEVQAFVTKVRAETDADKKKVLLEARKKELAASPRDKASYAKDFFAMFDG